MTTNDEPLTTEDIIVNLTMGMMRIETMAVTSSNKYQEISKITHNGKPLIQHLEDCITILGYEPSPELTKEGRVELINGLLTTSLNKLVTLELVKYGSISAVFIDPESRPETNIQLRTFEINSKGLEVALKLQEHGDNESRFRQQTDISKVLKDNSTKSVLTARVALALSVVLVCFGGYRVYQLEQKILSHSIMEARMNTTDLELGKLRDKNDLLVKELEAFKDKPVTTAVAQVDDTHQTKKKER